MTYREKRVLFTQYVHQLLKFFDEETPFECAISWSKRCGNCPVGRDDSLHKLSLAVDVDLYLHGVYLKNTISHFIPGMYWEKLHPDCEWGGQFNDGNHYSVAHDGRK